MSARISIADLRALSRISADDAVAQPDFDAICDAFPALVDAVEVAQRFVYATYRVRTDETIDTSAHGEQLRDALACFDFGDGRAH